MWSGDLNISSLTLSRNCKKYAANKRMVTRKSIFLSNLESVDITVLIWPISLLSSLSRSGSTVLFVFMTDVFSDMTESGSMNDSDEVLRVSGFRENAFMKWQRRVSTALHMSV